MGSKVVDQWQEKSMVSIKQTVVVCKELHDAKKPQDNEDEEEKCIAFRHF